MRTLRLPLILLFVLTAFTGGFSEKFPQLIDIDGPKFWKLIKDKENKNPLLVNFWASWCMPCIEEFPHLMELKKKYGNKMEFIFVSFDFEDSRENALKFLQSQNMTDTSYLNIENEQAFLKTMPEDWSGALPYTMLFNKKGMLVEGMEGGRTKEEFEEKIQYTLSNTMEEK